MNETAGTRGQWRGRLLLLLLASLFFGPLLLASVWYANADRWPLPDQHANHGELIRPVQTLSDISLKDLDGVSLPTDILRGRWSLIYPGLATCDAGCQEFLYQIRQVRTALGKHTDRVQRIYLLPSAPTDPSDVQALHELHPDLIVAVLASPDAARRFSSSAPGAPWPGTQLYVVDPLGNLMMRYGIDADPKGILADLERLLRLSQIG